MISDGGNGQRGGAHAGMGPTAPSFPPGQETPIRVVVAEDSVVMRSILRSVLTGPRPPALRGLPPIELCGMAADGIECLDAVRNHKPDLVLLDIEMPRLDGLGVLDKLRTLSPGLAVIMCSAMTERGASATLDALARGATDYVTKPVQQRHLADAIASLAGQLLPRIAALRSVAQKQSKSIHLPGFPKLAAKRAAVGQDFSSPNSRRGLPPIPFGARSVMPPPAPLGSSPQEARFDDPASVLPQLFGGAHLATAASAPRSIAEEDFGYAPGPACEYAGRRSPVSILVIGVSTGGPTALERFLPSLPADFPVPVVIVQHMPAVFTRMLARRLRERCALDVQETVDGAELKTGVVWIAKGDWHTKVSAMPVRWSASNPAIHPAEQPRPTDQPRGPRAKLSLSQGEMEHGCRPAANLLFRSAAHVFGPGVLGLVMTGMGSDGLDGARAIASAGGTILAQDQASSAIWGMPRRIAEAGLASRLLPLDSIAAELMWRVALPINSPEPQLQELPDGMLSY